MNPEQTTVRLSSIVFDEGLTCCRFHGHAYALVFELADFELVGCEVFEG